jgi:hypothetical protein
LAKRKKSEKDRLLEQAEKEILDFCDTYSLPKDPYVFEMILEVLNDSHPSRDMDKAFADEVKRRLIREVKFFEKMFK